MSVIGTGTSTFGGASFKITNNQQLLPRPGRTARYVKTPIPYGNLTTIQVGGYDTDDLTVDVTLDASAYAALLALVETVGTLTILGDSARTALFAKLASPRFYSEGIVVATATFVFS